MMYKELIKMLRTCSERDSCIGWKEACPYLGTGVCDNKAEKAADAIEELQKRVPPAPHGRLIDADALKFSPSEFWGFQATDNAKSAEAIVNQAPTIIPASEEAGE